MIQSMTGYGKSNFKLNQNSYQIELRSLNSKQMDLSIKLPTTLREFESQIRKFLSENLIRGKVDCIVQLDVEHGGMALKLNKKLVKDLLQQALEVLPKAKYQTNELILQPILAMPEVWVTSSSDFNEDDWKNFENALSVATNQLTQYRKEEGLVLKTDLLNRIELIESRLKEIEKPEKLRVEKVKERINKSLQEVIEVEKIDSNRFEQEMIYYLEKFDISEEKTRLTAHCNYFKETISIAESVGKKLNFISQEMGREINTIGSKANDAEIQKMVVQMKDELEKIKEQSFNVL
ncbi:MAG: YicC family protein [Bacteroidales bacterium]|nr:YicC family protein [Bacteroidales bacterium]